MEINMKINAAGINASTPVKRSATHTLAACRRRFLCQFDRPWKAR